MISRGKVTSPLLLKPKCYGVWYRHAPFYFHPSPLFINFREYVTYKYININVNVLFLNKMNYLKLKRINKLYFSFRDISKVLDISTASAKVTATRYVKGGYRVRLKRDLYVLKERWYGLSTEDKFKIANIIQVPSYISLTTALSYYGYTRRYGRCTMSPSVCKEQYWISHGEDNRADRVEGTIRVLKPRQYVS